MNKRTVTLVASIFAASVIVWFLSQANWTLVSTYGAYTAMALIFFGILVSNQQYEEDYLSGIERAVSAFLFSYIIFFRFMYVPLNQFFFGTLVTTRSFVSDLLALLLFMMFFLLFGTTALILNASSRTSLFSSWRIFNNEMAFFVFRILFIPSVAVSVLEIVKRYFLSL